MKTLLILLIVILGVSAQSPKICIAPGQFHTRMSQYNHGDDTIRRFIWVYDSENKREVLFEEMDAFTPGRKFYEYLIFSKENIMYTFDLRTHECSKSTPRRPWRDFGIPNNATFENEYTIGGPGEAFLAQEWSDRIPFRSSERWIGVFTLNECYPVREVIIANENVTETTTTNFYDTVMGIPNPNDFIPPRECMNATYAKDIPHLPAVLRR